MTRSTRPVFLNLTQIRMPVGALTSIGHRVTGVLLAAGVPVGVFLLDRSLQNVQGFADVSGLLGHGAVKVAVVLLVWALAHHVLGLRDVLLDYAKPAALRRLLLGLVAASLLGIAVWVVLILARLQT